MTDQDTIDVLRDCCETLYFQCVAMESILCKVAPEDWRHTLDKILKSAEASQIRAAFHCTFEAAVEKCDPTQLSDLLQMTTRRAQ